MHVHEPVFKIAFCVLKSFLSILCLTLNGFFPAFFETIQTRHTFPSGQNQSKLEGYREIGGKLENRFIWGAGAQNSKYTNNINFSSSSAINKTVKSAANPEPVIFVKRKTFQSSI